MLGDSAFRGEAESLAVTGLDFSAEAPVLGDFLAVGGVASGTCREADRF